MTKNNVKTKSTKVSTKAKVAKAKNVKVNKISNDNEALKFIKMIVIVTVVFLAFYLITLYVNKNKDKVETPKTEKQAATIQYDEILVSNIFDRPEKTYYVLVEDIEDEDAKVYEVYLSKYKSATNANRVYYSVLNNLFNTKYMNEKANLTNDLSKLKFKGTTLLLIENKKIKKSFEGNENITNYLTELTKSENK